jgi:hypothetical protein
MFNPLIDHGDLARKIGTEVFDNIYGESKYRYNNHYHFEFNKIIDDWNITIPPKKRIGVKIITPYYTAAQFTELDLCMMSARENSLIIKLPPDTTALAEVEAVLRFQATLARNGRTSANAHTETSDNKNSQVLAAAEMQERVRSLLMEALQGADFYANSKKIILQCKNPVERINTGLKILMSV